MKPNKDHIKDIFASKLKGFEPELPASLWEKIESDLPIQNIPQKAPTRTMVYKVLSWTAAAAAIALAVLYFIPQEHNDSKSIARLIVNNPREATQPLTQFKSESKQEISNETAISKKVQSSSSLLAEAKTEIKTIAKTKVSPLNETIPNKTATERIEVNASSTTPILAKKDDKASTEDPTEKENLQPIYSDLEKDLQDRIAAFEAEGEKAKNILADNNINSKPKRTEEKSKGLEVGIGGGSALSKSNDITNGGAYPAKASYDGLSSNTMSLRRATLKMEHNQPISFGLAINKKITNRISIETGVIYTYVSARIKLADQSDYNQNDLQFFHYFGIPLSINYKFAEWKKLEFYTSVGGVIQKDFYGRINSDSSIDDLLNTEHSSKRNISQERPQFSATGLLGLSYPLYRKLSVYSSFGGAYFFDAGNQYETIYSDRKWLFNLNMGLKFGF